jgi:hypothetical protein
MIRELSIGSTENKNSPQKINFENNEKIINIFGGCICLGIFFYSSFFNFFIFIF